MAQNAGNIAARSSKGRTATELIAEKEVILGNIQTLEKQKATATEIIAKKTQLDDVNREISEIEISIGKPIEQLTAQVTSTSVNIESQARVLAQQIVKETQKQKLKTSSGRVFTILDYESDVVENQQDVVTAGIWTNGIGTLTTFHTSSAETAAQKTYYYETYQSASTAVGSEPQFSVAYGHKAGSGSAITNSDYITKAIYSQYRLLLLEPDDDTFTFNGTDSNHIYVVNFNRSRLKEKLDPGNIELCIGHLSGSAFVNSVHTGSNVQINALTNQYLKLIDDSGDATQTVSVTGTAGKVYNVVSGSIAGGIYNSTSPNYFGLMYPDLGIVVLNADSLNISASFNTVTGSDVAGDNAYKLFTAISGAAVIDSTNAGFSARNEEKITSTHYFIRVKNGEYNFSNNPTFVTGSVGSFRHSSMIGDPKVYITGIGLYSDRAELLATAKLSQPILKSFSNESLIRVKLQF